MDLRGLVVCAVVVLASGCVGTEPGEGAPESPKGGTRESTVGEVAAPIEDYELTLSHPIWTEVCDGQGTNFMPVATFSEPVQIRFIENETRTTLKFEWTAVNPTAEKLTFRLWSGQDAIFLPPGPSPRQWELTPEDIALMGDRPELEGFPGCDSPGAVASFEDQVVAVHVEHFA